jgi:two-component system OmpR family response regulator
VADEKPLSTGEVARLLHVTPVAVLLWIRAGKLKAARVPGGRYRIARDDFRKFLADNQLPVVFESPTPRRILVVDDDPSVREALGAALQAKRCEVVLAQDGREALRTIRHDRFDLVFLDVKMPGMDGIETIREMKKKNPLTEVILLTGHASLESGIEGMKLGAFDYIMKPVNIDELLEKIRQAFERKQIQEQERQ